MHKNHKESEISFVTENKIKQSLRVYNDLICEKGALLEWAWSDLTPIMNPTPTGLSLIQPPSYNRSTVPF